MNEPDERTIKLERPTGFSIMAGLLALTAIGSALFWALLPIDAGTIGSLSTYQVWKRSFPLAEAWMALSAIAAAIGLLRMRDSGLLFGCLAGSALIFLGLTNVLFFLQNNLYTPLTTDAIVQIAIHLWYLTFGPFVIAYLWGKRQWFFL